MIISSPVVTHIAPFRKSSLVPSLDTEYILPGTEKTSLPSSNAKSTVINAPLLLVASITTTP